MARRPAPAGLLAVALLAGAAATARSDVLLRSRTVEAPVAPDAVISLNIPVGEVEIIGGTGDRLEAMLEVSCRSAGGKCAERAERVDFLLSDSGDGGVSLAIEPEAKNAYRDTSVVVRILVPPARTLDLEMGAGELTVDGVTACLRLRMFAGEADLSLPAGRVRSVSLDAGMGETNLYLRGDGEVEGRRPLLVGSKVAWDEGSGECDVEARLRFGEITLELE